MGNHSYRTREIFREVLHVTGSRAPVLNSLRISSLYLTLFMNPPPPQPTDSKTLWQEEDILPVYFLEPSWVPLEAYKASFLEHDAYGFINLFTASLSLKSLCLYSQVKYLSWAPAAEVASLTLWNISISYPYCHITIHSSPLSLSIMHDYIYVYMWAVLTKWQLKLCFAGFTFLDLLKWTHGIQMPEFQTPYQIIKHSINYCFLCYWLLLLLAQKKTISILRCRCEMCVCLCVPRAWLFI